MEFTSNLSSKYAQESQAGPFDLGSSIVRSPFSTSRLHLDLYDLCSRGDKPEYDDVDLISECSSPGAYIPGKYLQLCDISPDSSKDSLLWPVSLGATIRTESESNPMTTVQTTNVDESFSQGQVSRRHQRFSLQNPKYFVPLAVCVIVALFALGGLATII
ncbi:hypothetical protein Btru_075628 [Bulinus truncatus]|nr:hypothetical protein Btru_075628 [Bulinus truncatus]